MIFAERVPYPQTAGLFIDRARHPLQGLWRPPGPDHAEGNRGMNRSDIKRCVVIVHSVGDGLGVLAQVLVQQKIACRFWYISAEPDPPLSAPEADLVISLGGSQHPFANEADRAWQDAETAYVLAAISAGKAVLANCLGAQLLAGALGGRVGRLAEPEIGLVALDGIPAESVLAPLAHAEVPVYQWHGYGFSCPSCARQLAVSASTLPFCQAFEVGPRVLAVQFHLELNRSLMLAWLSEDPSNAELTGRVCAEMDTHSERTEKTCADVFGRWLPTAFDTPLDETGN
ncbi:MAG: hypothetical protein Tsb0019_10520 [Roseibium sp.]